MISPLILKLSTALILLAATATLPATTVLLGEKLVVSYNTSSVNVTGSYSAGIGYYVTVSGGQSLGVGYAVNVGGSYSLGLGSNNSIPAGISNSLVAGSYNCGAADAVTSGQYNSNTAPRSLVVGYHNIANTQVTNGIVAGIGNAAVTKPALLILGNGTESWIPAPNGYRSNAFVVYKDGDIVITKPQGDISMGSYQ